jgi:carbon monoxide dehydrogenase subunit G
VQLENSFTVAAPVEEAWDVLLDIGRVAPCMPGCVLESVEGDEFHGRVKVKVGPIVVTYKGTAHFAEVDAAAHRAVIEASGKEARGSGTAKATVTTELKEADDGTTEVSLVTDLGITGRPAQFGRSVLADVSAKLTAQFADKLAAELRGDSQQQPAGGATDEAGAGPDSEADVSAADARSEAAAFASEPTTAARTPAREAEPIDLLEVAGVSMAKRLASAAATLLALSLIAALLRRIVRARR